MPVIEVKNLTSIYCQGTAYERKSLDNISLSVEKGDVLGIVGENGSGKSTLIKHFNGLLNPTSGSVIVLGKDTSKKAERNELWKKVGMVFQFPEQQLFEDTVFNEIAYGLKNLGKNSEEIPGIVKDALIKVGLGSESIENISPLLLSGGMRRRTAIACILAMKPEILILDESTAGLDLTGRGKILDIIKEIKKDNNTTIIMVSHNLSELISVCSHIAVLKEGNLISYGKTREVLSNKYVQDTCPKIFPDYIQLIHRLSRKYSSIHMDSINLEEAEDKLDKLLGRGFKI